MTQFQPKMAQNIILWIHQHLMEMEKEISVIFMSKIDHENRNDNCISNFIISSYVALIPLHIENKYEKLLVLQRLHIIYIDFINISCSTICYLQKLLLNIVRILVKNDRFLW
eukprot:311552_1